MKDPHELATHLTKLHDQSLKNLYDIINGHKDCIRDLVRQAQDEVAAAVAASRATEGEKAENEDAHTAGDPATASGRSKRKQPATAPAAAEASQPPKRRGRPRKQPIVPVIEEAAECDDQTAAAIATDITDAIGDAVAADTTAAAAAADDPSAPDTAASAPAAAAARGRATRGRSTRVEPTAAALKTRQKRGAAPPTATGRSTRSRRGAAAETAAAAGLEAIAEEAEGLEQQEQQLQIIADNAQQQKQQEDELALQDAHMADTAAQQQQQQQGFTKQQQEYEQPEQEQHSQAAGSSELQQKHSSKHPPDTADNEHPAAPVAAGYTAADAGEEQHPDAAVPDTAADGSNAAAAAGGGGGEEGTEQQDDEFCLQMPSTAAAAAPPPHTPGFSLKPSSSKKPESETPCLGQSAGNSTLARSKQRVPSASKVGAASPAVEAAAASYDSADKGTAVVSIQRRVAGTASARRQGGSGFNAHSFSFGQALQGPLFNDAEDSSAAAAAASTAVPAAATAGEAGTAETAAAGAADWKAFLSTMHAGDAPTPAHSRQRLRSHSGAASVQQQQQQQQQQTGRRTTDITPAAAASNPSNSRKVSKAQQLFQSPVAGADAASTFTEPATGRRVTRSSMQSHPTLPSQFELAGDKTMVVADAMDEQQSSRGRRATTPRSAKKSIVAEAVAMLEAGAAGMVAQAEEQEAQPADLPASDAELDLAAGATAGHDEVPADDEAGMAEELEDAVKDAVASDTAAEEEVDVAVGADNETEPPEDAADADMLDVEDEQQLDVEQHEHEQQLQQEQDIMASEQEDEEPGEDQQQADAAAAAAAAAVAAAPATATAATAGSTAAAGKVALAASAGKGADALSAWLAATAAASAGVGDKARQQLEAAKEKAPVKSNLVSGIRSFVPAVTRKDAPPPAAGKVKVKVKAIEAAQAARQAEEARAAEKAARQQHQQQSKARAAGAVAAAAPKPQGTPSGAVAQSKVAAVERAATGQSGSGGAVRVLANKTEEEPARHADRDAAQKRAEKEAEHAKRAMDKAEREERMRRAEQKRKDEDMKRRAELAEKQRLKEERLAAAAALKSAKPTGGAAGGKAAGVRIAGGGQAAEAKAKPQLAAAAAADPSNYKTPAAPKAAARVPGATAAAALAANAAGGDSPSLEIKLLDPVSTGGKAAAHGQHTDHKAKKQLHDHGGMGPPAPVEGKTPATFKTPAPPVSEQEKRNVEALKSSPYVNPGSKRTPYSQQQQSASYIISPYRDDDVETPDCSHKPVPDWARSAEVYEAVKAQQHVDPDTIFGARQTTCDLGDMFVDVPGAGPQPHHRHKVRKLGQRTSSADWSQDRLTWQEEINYKKQAGWL